jgi:hypothetical protein
VQVTFEEGTWAAGLHDLLKPHVGKLVVCDPRRNALLQDGNQNDRVDARKLSFRSNLSGFSFRKLWRSLICVATCGNGIESSFSANSL